MADYEYFHDQYRRVRRNSVTGHRDLADYHSTTSLSTYNIWSGSIKRPMTTTYIDGSTLLGLQASPYSMKGLFPKGKGRRKSSTPCEKKINTGDVYISLAPADKAILETATNRSEKTRSPLSIATGTQYSTLPDVQRKSSNIRNNRLRSAVVFDDENSRNKFYGHYATAYANNGWIRRYKSINESQILTDLLRDPEYRDKILLRQRTCHQLSLLSSSSKASFASSFIKRRLAQC